MKRRREVREKLTKQFLLALMAPYLPTLKKGEKITDIFIPFDGSGLDTIEFGYIIVREEVAEKE